MRRRLLLVGTLLAGCGQGNRAATPARSEPSAAQQTAPSVPPDLAEPIRAAERRLAAAPDDPALLFELGFRHARAGDSAAALSLLERVAARRTGIDPEGSYDRLRDMPAYRALLSRIRRDFPPVTASTVALTIPERDLIPEGIAYDSTSGRFFVGSIHKRKVVAISPDGAAADFVRSGRDGLGTVLGLRVDSARRLLWAACMFLVRSGEGAEQERSGLAAFELSSGRLARRILLDSGEHTLNDLVVTRAGDIYVTDSQASEVYHLAPGTTRLDRIVDSARIFRPNGIALSPDESRLFVAAWPSIVVVDLRSGVVRPLRHAPNVVTGGIDGLYFHQGSLIGVQNDVHPGRVVRYALSPDLASIERADVLLSYHPRFEIPTTGAPADSGFYVIANTQMAKLGAGGLTVPIGELHPVVILRVDLR
jgi:sugar lactone lactonase YvrE